MPPIKRKGPGRNRKQRRVDAYEAEVTGRRRNDKRCSKCGEWGHNVRGCTNPVEQDRDQTQPRPKNKGGRPKTKPDRVVYDPETGQTRVLPTRGQTGFTARERAEFISAATTRGRGKGKGKGAGRGGNIGNVIEEPAGRPNGRGGGRGRGRGAPRQNVVIEEQAGRGRGRGAPRQNVVIEEQAGRGAGRAAQENQQGAGRGRGAGRGAGRAAQENEQGAGRGRGAEEPQMSQPAYPSTPQPRASTTPQSQPTPPPNPYMRPGHRNPSMYYRAPNLRVPGTRTSSRLSWLLGVDNEDPAEHATTSQNRSSRTNNR